MIRYESGDLLQSQTVALVNAVNCQGIMGKGIAYQFKEMFPNNLKVYQDACRAGTFKIGDILIVNEKQKLIVNFPTKDSWRKKSQYDFILQGLERLKIEIISRDIKSISIPPLGCGNGGLEWSRVESMIKHIFSDLESVDIVLYAPVTKESFADKKNVINVKHLLVIYAFKYLQDKKRYSLNSLFYIAQKISDLNYFDFSIKHNRPFSSDLDGVTKDIKLLKEKYAHDFDGFIDDYINTHLSKDIENEFKKIIPTLQININLLNKFQSKEEFAILPELFELLSNNDSEANNLHLVDGSIKEMVLHKMVGAGILQKNIFDQYEIIKPL